MIQAPFSNNEAKLIRQADQKFQNAGDWTIVLFNQIANLCTAGILNNIIVKIAMQRESDAKIEEGERHRATREKYKSTSIVHFEPSSGI